MIKQIWKDSLISLKSLEYRSLKKERKLEVMHTHLSIIKVSFFIMAFFFIFLLLIFSQNFYQKRLDTKIIYENLTSEEINNLKEMINKIDPAYFYSVQSITFTKDINKHLNFFEKFEDNYKGLQTMGINSHNKIVALYSKDKKLMSEIICHELLHSITYSNNFAHKIVYDLAKQEVCFK